MEGLKPYRNKYLLSSIHTKGVNFYFTQEKRIALEDVPKGYYRYRIKHADNPNVPVSLEKIAFVNHYHDVLADQRVEYLEQSNRNFIGLRKSMYDTD